MQIYSYQVEFITPLASTLRETVFHTKQLTQGELARLLGDAVQAAMVESPEPDPTLGTIWEDVQAHLARSGFLLTPAKPAASLRFSLMSRSSHVLRQCGEVEVEEDAQALS